LKASYSEEEIDGFYKTFKDNMANYEKINPEVVDTLFSFIDFAAFKKSILTVKNFTNENYDKANRADIEKI